MLRALRRLFHQATIHRQEYRFLFRPGPPDEFVVVDCETTGLDTKRDEIVTIAAIPVRGDRILTSERFEATLKPDTPMQADAIKVHRLREADVEGGRLIDKVLPEFLHFIGGRPLVGYYVDFDVAMLDKAVLLFMGSGLPNPRIEVSALYHERKYGDAPPGTQIDLRFAAIMDDLGLPRLEEHDAFNDALMTGMMYLALRDLKRRNVRIPRQRQAPVTDALGA